MAPAVTVHTQSKRKKRELLIHHFQDVYLLTTVSPGLSLILFLDRKAVSASGMMEKTPVIVFTTIKLVKRWILFNYSVPKCPLAKWMRSENTEDAPFITGSLS